jgi:hypothetical protein
MEDDALSEVSDNPPAEEETFDIDSFMALRDVVASITAVFC